MKKVFLSTFGLALLSILFLSFNKNRDNLVGNWKVTKVEPKISISEKTKNEMVAHGSLTFTEDGHVMGYLIDEIHKGTFALTKKGKSLVIKEDTRTPYPCESTITENKLILENKQIKITLKKIN